MKKPSGSESVQIPTTINEAVEALGGLGQLITARKWERAAIVAAFVRLNLGEGGHEEPASSGQFVSAREFAEKKIIGLTSKSSVSKYVQAWLDVHDGKYPKPGSKRVLPTVDFPPMRTGTDGHSTTKGMTETVSEMIERHGAEAVATAVTDVAPDASEKAVVTARGKALRERYDLPFESPPPGLVPDWILDFGDDLNRLHTIAERVTRTLREHPEAAIPERIKKIERIRDLLAVALMEASVAES